MEVIAYLHNADLLLEDEKGIAVICGSHYVLSIGDQVYLQELIDQQAKLYQVKISFASAEHIMMHDDEIQLKFEGDKHSLESYLKSTTVH